MQSTTENYSWHQKLLGSYSLFLQCCCSSAFLLYWFPFLLLIIASHFLLDPPWHLDVLLISHISISHDQTVPQLCYTSHTLVSLSFSLFLSLYRCPNHQSSLSAHLWLAELSVLLRGCVCVRSSRQLVVVGRCR